MGLRPVTDLVVQAWVASLPDFSADMVGAVLPQDTSGWSQTGFIQAAAVSGGVPDPDTGLRRSVVQMDCWAVRPGSAKPPWFRANQLTEAVLASCVDGGGQQATVDLGPHYDPARVLTVRALGEPRRIWGDDAGYARFQVDVEIVWIRTEVA
jgi:hypothetical protein